MTESKYNFCQIYGEKILARAKEKMPDWRASMHPTHREYCADLLLERAAGERIRLGFTPDYFANCTRDEICERFVEAINELAEMDVQGQELDGLI